MRNQNIKEDVHKDVLVKPRAQFSSELDNRLEIGNELLQRHISNTTELAKAQEDFDAWDDYNEELLKRSFDRPNNDYHRDYCVTAVFFGTIGGSSPTFTGLIQKHKTNVDRQFTRLKKIRDKVDLIDVQIDQNQNFSSSSEDPIKSVLIKIQNLLSKFHRIAQTLRIRHDNRQTLIISDEYDVQDLLRSLLKEHFDDVRDEDYVPSYAGSNSRVDFVLKNESVVIEVKMTNEKLHDREIGNQLLIDIGRYKSHPDCKLLVLFIYDRGDYIINKPGLIRDLERLSSSQLTIRTFINPA